MLRWSLEKKRVNLCIARGPFGAIISMKIEEKLEELVNHDVIEQAQGPTPWVSPVVVVPKPTGDIRLCVDMRKANRAIVRESPYTYGR